MKLRNPLRVKKLEQWLKLIKTVWSNRRHYDGETNQLTFKCGGNTYLFDFGRTAANEEFKEIYCCVVLGRMTKEETFSQVAGFGFYYRVNDKNDILRNMFDNFFEENVFFKDMIPEQDLMTDQELRRLVKDCIDYTMP